MVGWAPPYDGPDTGTTTTYSHTSETATIESNRSYVWVNTTSDYETENSVDLDWWLKEKKKAKDIEKMKSKWKYQKKQHNFHQSKWGHNKPRCRR